MSEDENKKNYGEKPARGKEESRFGPELLGEKERSADAMPFP